MRKLFIPYYSAIVTVGLLIAANAFVLDWEYVQISTAFLLILIMTNLSESVYYFFTSNTTMTLSCAITIFSTMIMPFSQVVLTILAFTLFGRVAGVMRKEFKKILNMKWLFNFATFVILAKLASLCFKLSDFKYLKPIDQTIVIVGVCLVYNIVNVLLLYGILSLSSGENAFKEYRLSEYLIYSFYNIMFTMLLWFGFTSYDNLGLAFMAILIVPLQRSIMMQSKSDKISQMLIEDPLTKARNRQYFEDVIYEKLDKQMAFSMIFLDLDKFKSINDTYGHLIGDEVLVDLVAKIKAFMRPDDIIFRYGGDEFCILTYDMAYGEILHELLKKNSEHFNLESSHGNIKYSFSMSLVEYDGLSRDSYRNIMQKADKYMYKRKLENRKQVS